LQAQWLTSDQATPATTPTASVAEIARMVRKDSIHSAASPTTAKVVPGPETPLAHFERHLEEWQACKGHPETFMQKELRTAEEDLESLKQNTPKIERAVKEFQQQHVAAQEELERMEQFQKDSDAAAEKAGVHLGRHKAIREEWKAFPMKHVQLAWAENNRCSEAWQKAEDREDSRGKKGIGDVRQVVQVQFAFEQRRLTMASGYAVWTCVVICNAYLRRCLRWVCLVRREALYCFCFVVFVFPVLLLFSALFPGSARFMIMQVA
jgi:small-conductance mechanosensitive channel